MINVRLFWCALDLQWHVTWLRYVADDKVVGNPPSNRDEEMSANV